MVILNLLSNLNGDAAERQLTYLTPELVCMGLDVSPFWQLHKNYVLFQKFLPGNAWDTDLIWHEDQYWPEYLHLVDALGLPDLKMPEMDY